MDSDSLALSLRDATLYRRLVSKLNYLAMDRPDIRYAASIMGSHASSPKDADMVILKRGGAISDQATDHLDAPQVGSAETSGQLHATTNGCGPHSTSRTWVGEARAHETSLAASSDGRRPVRCGADSDRA